MKIYNSFNINMLWKKIVIFTTQCNIKSYIKVLPLCVVLVALLVFPHKTYATELKASWYSVESLKKEGTWKNGKEQRMANGCLFSDSGLTCANRLYPLGTYLKITNTRNGKSVICKTTDRIGKRFAKTRIDLSKRAFSEIADLKCGVIPITVEVVNGRIH